MVAELSATPTIRLWKSRNKWLVNARSFPVALNIK